MTEQVADSNASVTTVVSRVVAYPVKRVWAVLLSAEGQEALLGEGALLGDKGDRWKATDGTWGVTRSYHPLEEIRFSWHKDDDSPKTWVEVTLTPLTDSQTKITLTHDHSNTDFDVTKVTARWKAALSRIDHDALEE
ncbi:MAG: SRPBCC domain-containing protein [Propionibacteriaceae bacterium]|nr:SRPBCC domain-containing protein [Propionibacteriaceae bacterium]